MLDPSYFFDLSAYRHRELFDDCVYVWDALKRIKPYLARTALGVIDGDVAAGAFLVQPELISIGKGSIVEPGAYIQGPCVIGEGCTIRHGAYIRGDVIVGNRCVIGHDTEMKHAVMLDGAHAAHFAYVGDSILGNKVNLGAGTKCANLRLDNGQVVLHIAGSRYETGLRKFGAILGDGTQTGCNSVANPGTLTGKQVVCYPCTPFGGFIPSEQVIRLEAKVIAL